MNIAPFRTLLLGTVGADGTVTGVTTGTSQPINVMGYSALTVYTIGTDTISSGTILLEECDINPADGDYGGTWATLATVTASGASGGAQVATHVTAGYTYEWVRARISSEVKGGASVGVAVVLVGR